MRPEVTFGARTKQVDVTKTQICALRAEHLQDPVDIEGPSPNAGLWRRIQISIAYPSTSVT